MNTPLVSVGMPVYNTVQYVQQAVESVLSQTHTNIELIISDNASTDGTTEVLQRLAETDERIVLLVQDRNRGAAWNYNEVFRRAQGSYFRWVAADDRIAPKCLEECVERLEGNANAVLCYPQTTLIDEDGRPITTYDDRLELLSARARQRAAQFILNLNLCNPVFGVHRTASLGSTRLIQSFQGSDAVLLLETVLRGTVIEVPEPLFDRRVHGQASLERSRSRREIERWFNPDKANRLHAPVGLRLLGGYLGACNRAPLPSVERLTISAVVAALFTYRRLRAFGGRWKRRLLSRDDQPHGRWGGLF